MVSTKKHPMRAKLVFNPGSGTAGESPVQLMDVTRALQAWNIIPETHLVEPDSDLPEVVRDALKQGIRMFVVCGGDGTIDVMAGALAGTDATLGIIPTGTQNNVALSLGIPADIPAAIAILRTGRRVKVDLGLAVCGEIKRSFLEVCSVGLLSALFPSADDIQHGNLARIGDFLSTMVASPPAEMHLILDNKQEINTLCHVVLVSNMPYIGPHFQVGNPDSINDGLMDVLLFADLSKLDLLGYAVQSARIYGGPEDERIQHYHVRRVDVDTNPAMPVMADGSALGEGPLHISVQRRALAIMVGEAAPRPDQGVIPEEPTGETPS
ncbi:MAG TPA: diacylglycerol kinase family protein [Anaerolineales bacterium]